MEDKKVLGQFHAKISKAKILYDTTSATNQKLRRQATQLQRQYESVRNNRIETEAWQKDAHDRMENMKNRYKEQNQKCFRETRQLNDLKNNKKELEREKIYCEAELQRCDLQLEELIKNREELEATAKSLTQKLQSTTAQKNVLQQEHAKTLKAIEKYNKNINSLRQEIEQARQVITTNTVPVHNIYEQEQRNSREKVSRG